VEGEAWETAREAAGKAGVHIRPLGTLDQAGEAVEVMAATWGPHQLVPRELLRAFQSSGNVLIGAYEGERMVGFVLGFMGWHGQGFHLHSHMLAVVPERRDAGIGYALKLAQRAASLDAGVPEVRWTFDPLVARNAHFNLVKLGAVADRFHRHFYGDMPDSLNRGDRSDRLEVLWDLRSRPPTEVRPLSPMKRVLSRMGPEELPRPSDVSVPPGENAAVQIPRDYPVLRERDLALAAEWREAVAEAMETCFGAGLRGVWFLPDSTYLFSAHAWPVQDERGSA
jgi:predicted GNAT superfamily acetyltransferase